VQAYSGRENIGRLEPVLLTTATFLRAKSNLILGRETLKFIYTTIGSTKTEDITESCENITKQLIETIVETKRDIANYEF
jgi:hypothetical protein